MRHAMPAVAAIFAALLGCGGGKRLTSLTVAPAPAIVAAGYARQLTARGIYSDGTAEDLTATVTWSSSDEQLATVSATGLVAARQMGSVEIAATLGDVSASRALLVRGPPDADNTVTALAVGPDGTAYLGGDFTYVGPTTGALAPFDLASGHVALAPFPKFEGWISVVQPDGRGGRYVGGQFTAYGPHTSKSNLAHVEADGSLDPDFSPEPDAGVSALALHGDTLIAGGSFARIGGQSAPNLAALDAATGNAVPANLFAPAYPVEALALDGDVLAVAGPLSFDGSTWQRLATVDLDTGAVRWLPADGPVSALASSDRTLYAAGEFTTIGGLPRRGLAAIDVPTGAVTGWDPSPDGPVASIAVSGGYAYVAGGFTHFGGEDRPWFAQLDLSSGSVTPWSPLLNMRVSALAASPDAAYLAGDAGDVDCPAARYLLKISAGGEVTTWRTGANGPISGLDAADGRLFAGGDFTIFDGVCRKGLASIDTTGSVTEWNPSPDGLVLALQASGSTLYVGGTFTTIGAQARLRLAAFDASGNLAAWNPSASDYVTSLALGPDGTVYAGGWFSAVGGQPRSSLAAIDPAGAVTPWNPGADRVVDAIAVNGDTIFTGGWFTHLGGQLRPYLGAVSASSGMATAWNPGVHCPRPNWRPPVICAIQSLTLGTGGRLYVGGNFDTLDGQERAVVAAFDASGSLSDWHQSLLRGGPARALAASGGTLYVGGEFSRGGDPLDQGTGLAALDERSGGSMGWNPDATGSGFAMAVAPDGSVFWGGSFTPIGVHKRSCFGRVPLTPQP